MNPENKKAARERRAAEREREKKVKTVRIVARVLALILAVVLLFFGLKHSNGGGKADQEKNTSSQSQEQKDKSQTSSDGGNKQTDSAKSDPEYKAKSGDTVSIHYVGKVGDTAFYGGTGDYDLKLGSGSFIAGFEDQVIGHKKGETFDVNVTFPANYRSTYAMKEDGQEDSSKPITLANAKASFTVTIKEIK